MIRTLALLLLFAATARAQEPSPYVAPQRLSDRGRTLIAGQLGGWWQNHDNWHVNITPSLSYFLTDRIGVGAFFGYRNERLEDGLRQRAYSLGVRSTNELPLDERLGLWILASVGYTRRDDDGRPVPAYAGQPGNVGVQQLSPFSPIRNWLTFGVSLPLVYQLNRHVGLGIGPDLAIGWSPAAEHTNVIVGMSTWIPISI